MAKVVYKNCKGDLITVDYERTFEICSDDPTSFEFDRDIWRIEVVGQCQQTDRGAEDPPIKPVDLPKNTAGVFRVAHDLPSNFTLPMIIGGKVSVGPTGYSISNAPNLNLPSFVYSRSEVLPAVDVSGKQQNFEIVNITISVENLGDFDLLSTGLDTYLQLLNRAIGNRTNIDFTLSVFLTMREANIIPDNNPNPPITGGPLGNTDDVSQRPRLPR